MYAFGTGVVISAGLYLSEMGKILVFGGAVDSAGVNRRIPLPFVGVASGNNKIVLFGFFLSKSGIEIRSEGSAGRKHGGVK